MYGEIHLFEDGQYGQNYTDLPLKFAGFFNSYTGHQHLFGHYLLMRILAYEIMFSKMILNIQINCHKIS